MTVTPTHRGISLRDRISFEKSRRMVVLTNKDGIEVSIPNILIAVGISLVIITGVVIAGVFAIPYSQNAAAAGDLQTVQSAESIFYGNSASGTPTYATAAQLVSGQAMLASSKPVAIKATTDRYCIGTKALTGDYFWMTSGSSTVVKDTAPTVSGTPAFTCPTTVQIDALKDATGTAAGISLTSPVIP